MSEGVFADAIEALTFARHGTISEAKKIPVENWDFRPHANAKSVSELVCHIVEAGLMLVGEAADPEGDFTRRPPADHMKEHAGHLAESMTPSELLEALESSLDTGLEWVRTSGEQHWMSDITRFDGKTWKRLTYLFYAGAHEQYHCGQLATYARSMGLVPALTKQIHGEDAE